MQKKSWKKPKRRPQAMDYSILFLVLFLVGFGLVILYSTSSYKASLLYNDTTYWVKKQALFAAMGICGMLFIATRDYHIWQKKWWFAWVIYGGVIGLLLLTFAIGAASHGSQRWISMGPFSLQWKSVSIPSGLSWNHVTLHCTVTRNHILDYTS